MKIITWNVNGLRAALGKDALRWAWEQQPDILCLQEIKARPDQLKEEHRNFPGYDVIWNPAEQPGYSGVATFLRNPSLELQLGMDAPLFDKEDASFPRFIPVSVYSMFTSRMVSAAKSAWTTNWTSMLTCWLCVTGCIPEAIISLLLVTSILLTCRLILKTRNKMK